MSLTYAMLSTAFAEIKDADTKRVGEIIGGKVKENIDSGIFIDCCAIRMSYADE
ncbi:hypothetical protein AGMMS50239_07110 [Bacteroidia bacterium]|nr:hypothetical protein AGMMS50239_07110 [Bacteroidia bacterium]